MFLYGKCNNFGYRSVLILWALLADIRTSLRDCNIHHFATRTNPLSDNHNPIRNLAGAVEEVHGV